MPTDQVTWLTPYYDAWKAVYPQSEAPVKQMARFFKPLVKAHPVSRIVGELSAYLARTPPQYLNLSKFASAFGAWGKPTPEVERRRCAKHPDREATGSVSHVRMCQQCFEEALP